MRAVVAALFVVSVIAAGVVDGDDGDPSPVRTAAAASTTSTVPATTTTAAPTTLPVTAPPTVATTAAPAPPTTSPPNPVAAARTAPSGVVVTRGGLVLPLLRREGDAFLVETPCARTAVVQGTLVERATVVLDPGHGGAEPGAVGPNGLSEKGINLAVVNHAKAALERAGVSTMLTRTGDQRVTLSTRAKVAKALHPKAFVSIHHNAEPDGPRETPGSETYYQIASLDSKRLSGLVYEEVVKALSGYTIPWVADTDAGAKYRVNSSGGDYYGVLRLTQGVTAVLAELAFVSNPPEAALLTRPDVQQVEGEAVAKGILRFLNTGDPGSGYTEPYPRTSPAGGGGGSSGCVDPPL
ncbi:MAG TPA: N-acetylmuramoyl-L-alanine amidase [Acidimicrobiales bacterium]|nr:N-acetylmuramoyl-L-alanine amidase [Acidimicrobiales bacterium]